MDIFWHFLSFTTKVYKIPERIYVKKVLDFERRNNERPSNKLYDQCVVTDRYKSK